MILSEHVSSYLLSSRPPVHETSNIMHAAGEAEGLVTGADGPNAATGVSEYASVAVIFPEDTR